MKILSLIISFLFTTQAYCFENLGTQLMIDGSQLCIKSLSRKKCSTDSFTKTQTNNMLKKIKAIESQIPSYILNDVLNNFWANNHKFSSAQLMSIFERANSSACNSQVNILNERKGPIQNQMNKLEDQLRELDKGVVRSCMNPKLANKVYPKLNIPKEFENNSGANEQTNQ